MSDSGSPRPFSSEPGMDEDRRALREIQDSMVNMHVANGGEAELLSPVTANPDGMMALLGSLYGEGNADATKKLGRGVEENTLDIYKTLLSKAAKAKGFSFESLEELYNRVGTRHPNSYAQHPQAATRMASACGNLSPCNFAPLDYCDGNQVGHSMTLNFFATKPADSDGKRHSAINTVSVWMWGRTHLPKDLQEALYYLIPELKRGMRGGFDDHGEE